MDDLDQTLYDDRRPEFSLGKIHFDIHSGRYETDTNRYSFKSVVDYVLHVQNIARCHSVSFLFIQEVIRLCLNKVRYHKQASRSLYNAIFGLQIHQNTYTSAPHYLNKYINELNTAYNNFIVTMSTGSGSTERERNERVDKANRLVDCMNSLPYNLRIPPANLTPTYWNGWNSSISYDYDPTSWILLNNNIDVIRSSDSFNCNTPMANEPLWQNLSSDYQQVFGNPIPVPGQNGFYLTYLNDSHRIKQLRPITNLSGAPVLNISKGLSEDGEDFIYSSNNAYPKPDEDSDLHSNEDIYYLDLSTGSWQLF